MTRLAIAFVLLFSAPLYADDVREEASSISEKAWRLSESGKPLEAIELLNTALEKAPENLELLLLRADCFYRADEAPKAMADFDRMLKLKPTRLQRMIIFNNMAYHLATSPNDDARDGKRAVDFAETAKLLLEEPSADVLDTLAAAYAEAGQFEKAIEAAHEAIKLAPEIQREEFRKYLKLYEARKPRRDAREKSQE